MAHDAASEQPIQVFDRDGRRGLLAAGALEQPGDKVPVTFDHGRTVQALKALLQPRADGHYDLPVSLRALNDATATDQSAAGNANAGNRGTGDRLADGVVAVVPVVEEVAKIATREVETGRVRIRKTVETAEEEVDVPLLRDRVQVERVPVDRYVDSAIVPWYEGETLVIPVLEEVLVVEKRLLLREEIRVTTVREESVHRESVSLRREQVDITRQESGESEERPLAAVNPDHAAG